MVSSLCASCSSRSRISSSSRRSTCLRSVASRESEPPPWFSSKECRESAACAAPGAGAEGEGTGLELRAFDGATGEELDRSHAERAVSVRACAPERKVPDVRFELRTTSGKLDVVIGERVR